MMALIYRTMSRTVLAGMLAAGLFWGLLGHAWWAAKLTHRTGLFFVLLWTAGMVGFPYLAIGRGAFTVWVALLDIVLIFLVFKRDFEIPTRPE